MPAKTLTNLTWLIGILFAVYVVFVVVTIFFATWQTELSASVREREAEIVALESEYYDAISSLTQSDPYSIGYVNPSNVKYVAADGAPTVTRADR